MVLFAGHGMQVTKEIVTLLEANKSSFAAVGLSYDGEDATFVVTAVDVDTTNLETLWNNALAEADAITTVKWEDLEVRRTATSN